MSPRDFDQDPYSKDEARVAKAIVEMNQGQIGAGDDPIGFLLSAYYMTRDQREAAELYAGFLAIEVSELGKLVVAQGCTGWPDHQVMGEILRDRMLMNSSQLIAKAKKFLAEWKNTQQVVQEAIDDLA